ncbi:MAG: universal stress protein [Chloroflexota bacterium]|nr:universal stress protein [Chloroflexota bacterium]
MTLLQSITPVEHVVAAESGMPSGFVDPTPIVEEERHEAVTYLEAVAGRLRSRGPSVQCEQTEGTAAEAILGHARRTATELIALTTHGRGGLGRLVFGSVAEGVLRQALCPVLILRVSEGSAT